MDKEFAVILNSLTKEGQERLINTVADFVQASDVVDGIYKEALSKEEKDKANNTIAGGAATGLVGAGVAKGQYDKGNLTGRESMYHNTQKRNIPSINESGILASKGANPDSITNKTVASNPFIDADKLKGKTYMARKKMVAHNISRGVRINQLSSEERKTIKAKVPSWKMKEVDNPELQGTKSAKAFGKKLAEQHPNDPKAELTGRSMYGSLSRKGTATFQGDVSPKYIKGSKHFKRLGAREFGEFVKKNPKRFIKGTGKAALGLGIAGAGAHLIHKGIKGRMNKKASDEEYRSVLPKALGRYTGGFIAGSAIKPWLEHAASQTNRNRKLLKLISALPAVLNPNSLGLMVSTPGIVNDLTHNARLQNEDRSKLDMLLSKNACSFIDALYKKAKMEVPTPQEAKKETNPKKQKDDRPVIKCEKCGFEGKSTPRGECPSCGALMGVKPTDYPIPYTPVWTEEPMSGISVEEANNRGRADEAW